jgi:alpha-galactosidase
MPHESVSRRRLLQAAITASTPLLSLMARESNGIRSIVQRPPMGWNSFDSYGGYLNESAAMANLKALEATLKPAGYEYFVIDSGWFGEYKLVPGTRYPAEKHASDVRLNQYGILQPSRTHFPGGFEPIAEYAHKAGLKFGLHLMRGIPRKAVELNLPVQGTKIRARDIADTNSICPWCPYNYGVDMSKPGAQAFYTSVVHQLARWGVDLIKADDIVPYPREILALANAIEEVGRKITLSLSPGNKAYLCNLPYYRRGNMLRITSDMWDRRSDLAKGFDAWTRFSGTACPGFWPDLDMIPFGQLLLMSPKQLADKGNPKLAGFGYRRWCQFTPDQQYTFITMRALAASPLFMGGDLPSLDSFSLALLTHKEMVACSQNGVMGTNVYRRDNVEVWLASERSRPGNGWLGIFNRNENDKWVPLGRGDLGLDPDAHYRARDIWKDRDIELDGKQIALAADGVLFLRFEQVHS